MSDVTSATLLEKLLASEKRVGKLEAQLDQLEASYSDSEWLLATRQAIELYESEFKKYEYSVKYLTNFTPSIPVFKKDTNKLKVIPGFLEQQEELRRQRWEHYLNNPPSTLVQSLVDNVNQKSNVADFAVGIARAFKVLSEIYHKGAWKGTKKPLKTHIDMLKGTNNAVDILLENIDLSKQLFSYS